MHQGNQPTIATAARVWRSRPIFISSTFKDFHAERDYLSRFVFPELEERLRKRRCHLEHITLADFESFAQPKIVPLNAPREHLRACGSHKIGRKRSRTTTALHFHGFRFIFWGMLTALVMVGVAFKHLPVYLVPDWVFVLLGAIGSYRLWKLW